MSSQYMPVMRTELEHVINRHQTGFVLENEDMILGYITLLKLTETYKLETLAVHPDYQGKGIGRKLIIHVEDFLNQSTVEENVVLNLVTDDSSDDPVKDFYLRCGFKVSGIVENEYRFGDRQIHLSKILKKI